MGETLDGVRLRIWREGVDCTIDDAVATIAKNLDELQRTIVDEGANRRWRGRGGGLR